MRIPFSSVALALLFFVLLSGLGSSCLAAEQDILQQVDNLLSAGENQQAWEILQNVPGDRADDLAILWRKARTKYEMGRLAETDDQALKLLQESVNLARNAIAAAPDQGDGYKWLAIALGAQLKYVDVRTVMRQTREIKENIDKAIALAPDDDIAYLVLSRWNYKIADMDFWARSMAKVVFGGLPEASFAEAERLLRQAIKLHDRVAHRYNLGRVYDRMKRRDEANQQYRQALLLPVTFPEEAEEQAKAREKLEHRK